jgi:hypothetical protein
MAEIWRTLLCALFSVCVDEEPAPPAFTVEQMIESTIAAGDGSNPNQDGPMGAHDAPLFLPQGWSWTQGATRNEEWGTIGTGNSLFVEWRCSVIPELDHMPSVPFRVNVRDASYWQFADDEWTKGFDVNLVGGHKGSYLGVPGEINGDPFGVPDSGHIEWRQEPDGSFSAPWNPDALFMHFWAGQRLPALEGQTAEMSVAEIRLQQPDGETVDLREVNVLFQCGLDYYSVTGGEGTKVPGPGIGKYHRATGAWQPTMWVTLPADAPAGSSADFRSWLGEHTPPPLAATPGSLQSETPRADGDVAELRIEEVASSVEFIVDSVTPDEEAHDFGEAALLFGGDGFEASIEVCHPGVATSVDCLRRVQLPNPELVDVEHERRTDDSEIVLRDRTTGDVLVRLRTS